MTRFEADCFHKTEVKDNSGVVLLVSILALIVGFFLYVFKGQNVNIIIFIVFFVLVLLLSYVRKSGTVVDSASLGKLSLSPTEIVVADTSFELRDLKSLSVLFHSYKGQEIRGDRDQTVYFFVESETHKAELCDLITSLYLHRVKFFEGTVGKARTYGLQHLNYSGVQEFKQRHGIANVFPLTYKDK